MQIKQLLIGTLVVTASLGVGSAASAGDIAVEPRTPPPPAKTVGDFAVIEPAIKSSTCEGDISCGLLGSVCNFLGGQYNDHESRDHGHTHGICTWPWE